MARQQRDERAPGQPGTGHQAIQQEGGTRQDATELYLALLDKLAARGLARPESATPMEFARRLPDEHAARVMRFTRVYNAVRFGGQTAATSELAEMLAAFDR